MGIKEIMADMIAQYIRGRPRHMKPTPKVEEILNLLRMGLSFAAIGREYNYSRQYIHQLKKRWIKFI
jgi:DNA-binding NarL/FixJ family response regulator